MSTKVIAARRVDFFEVSPLAKHIRNAGRWLFQRVSPTAIAAERALAIEERISIGPKKVLVLVRCHGQRFLVAAAGDNVGPIVEIAPRKTAVRTRKGREA